jgi:TolB-like protein
MSEAWNQELIRTLAQVPAGSQETMLQGSVQKDSDHPRITAQLIRVQHASWAQFVDEAYWNVELSD